MRCSIVRTSRDFVVYKHLGILSFTNIWVCTFSKPSLHFSIAFSRWTWRGLSRVGYMWVWNFVFNAQFNVVLEQCCSLYEFQVKISEKMDPFLLKAVMRKRLNFFVQHGCASSLHCWKCPWFVYVISAIIFHVRITLIFWIIWWSTKYLD